MPPCIRTNSARYASIGGKLNPKQPTLIKDEILRMPAGSRIVSAMDNDAAGHSLVQAHRRRRQKLSGRSDLSFTEDLPEAEGADWNDVLKDREPPARFSPHPSIQSARLRRNLNSRGPAAPLRQSLRDSDNNPALFLPPAYIYVSGNLLRPGRQLRPGGFSRFPVVVAFRGLRGVAEFRQLGIEAADGGLALFEHIADQRLAALFEDISSARYKSTVFFSSGIKPPFKNTPAQARRALSVRR